MTIVIVFLTATDVMAVMTVEITVMKMDVVGHIMVCVCMCIHLHIVILYNSICGHSEYWTGCGSLSWYILLLVYSTSHARLTG